MRTQTLLAIHNRYPFFLVTTLVFALLSCGGGGGGNNGANPAITSGPRAILNGSSLATATSYWISQNCSVKVAVAADGGLKATVTDTSGTTYTSGGTWTAADNNGLTVSESGGSVYLSRMSNISGSTSAGSFSAGLVFSVQSTGDQNIGPCTFSLQQGSFAS